ncbi:MAG: OsmC family protein [Maritimibacter sp.]|jgi:putative redox protein
MDVRVKWGGDRSFVGTAGTGHQIVFGAATDSTAKPGPTPMELMLMGTGGCSAFDVVQILEKGRQKVEDVQVVLSAERAETEPKVFTQIHMHFIVKGRGIAPEKVERAINLSVEKYCSASAMMEKSADLTHDFEIVETGEE